MIKNKYSRKFYSNDSNRIKYNMRNRIFSAKYREMNKTIMHDLKINGCAICGYNKCDAALDFHHTNPDDKKISVNLKSLEFAVDRIANEISKCILLCKNCHYEIHNKGMIDNATI